MSKYLIAPVLLAGAALLWFWLSGGFDSLAAWAAGEQRAFQNKIASTLRGLRGGQPGAVTLLLSVCFAYGFFHAVGPGHGKVLIGGYGLGRQVPWFRLSVISLLSSLGQAVTAIALVYAGVLLFNLTRERMTDVTENVMAPVSYAAIGLIGLWLVWRGVRRLMREQASADHAHHGSGEVCGSCGHKHGPSLDEVDQIGTLREAAILIGGIAARPCTGALFLLIITWQMGIRLIGVAGAFAMALGTATVTIAVGLAAVGLRGGLVGALTQSRFAARLVPLVELSAGLVIAVIATGLLMRAV